MATRGRAGFIARMGGGFAGSEPPDAPPPTSGASGKPATSPAAWSVAEVSKWLADLGYKQYAGAFKSSHITGAVLPLLSKDVLLTELGVEPLGHRLLILQAVRKLFPDAEPQFGGAGVNQISEIASQTAKACQVVVGHNAEMGKITAELDKLKKGLKENAEQLAAVVKEAAKPAGPAMLSADTQARLSKCLKQGEAAAAALAELRTEMKSGSKGTKTPVDSGSAPAKAPAAPPAAAPAPSTADKGDTAKAGSKKPEKADKAEKVEKAEKGTKPDKADKGARGDKAKEQKPARAEQPSKAEQAKSTKPANQAALGTTDGGKKAAGGKGGRGKGEAATGGDSKAGKGRGGKGKAGDKEADSTPKLQMLPAGPSTVAFVLGGKGKGKAAAVAAPVAKGGAAIKAPALLQARLGVLSLCEVKLAIELF